MIAKYDLYKVSGSAKGRISKCVAAVSVFVPVVFRSLGKASGQSEYD